MALPATEASPPPAAPAAQQEASAAPSADTTSPVAAPTLAQTAAGPAAATPPGAVGVSGDDGRSTSPTYRSVTTGQPYDPTAAQAAAIAQQHAMYSGFGSPYALHGSVPPSYSAGAPPMYYPAAGAAGAHAPFYTMKLPTLPGPCYYDPYGMLNPAACIAPMRMAYEDEHASTKLLAAKKQSRWCC